MSATVTSSEVRLPVTRFGGLIAGAMIVIAVAALIGIAYTFVVRDNGPAAAFDPTAAQRIQVVREYGSSAAFDSTPALQTHVSRENGAAVAPGAGSAQFDQVLRENKSD